MHLLIGRWLRKCGYLWIVAASFLHFFGTRAVPEGRYDAIIVAGCRVDPGGQPSLALQRRTRRAVDLWKKGEAPVVIFTGGVGTYPPAEAVAASGYARDLGLPESAIRTEVLSTSTEENAKFSAEQFELGRVIVVTDSYHAFRAGRVFGRFLITSSYRAHLRGGTCLSRAL